MHDPARIRPVAAAGAGARAARDLVNRDFSAEGPDELWVADITQVRWDRAKQPPGGGKRYGFECKFADAPGTTRSMRVAIEDLGLDHLWIVYPGDEGYVLDDRISVLPVAEIGNLAGEIAPKGW